MPESAVGYIRVSSEDLQGDNFSLPQQTHSIREFAQKHGYLLHHIFEDKDTGSELDRESFLQLLDYVEAHKINAVIVYRLDRLGRGEVEAIAKYMLGQRGAVVVSATEPNEDTPEGRALRGMISVFSGYERETIIRRSKDGRKSRARMGNVLLTTPPFGYRVVRPDPKTSRLEIDEEEARVVAMIFRWYIIGDDEGGPMTIGAICRRLTDLGIPTRNDRSSISKQTQRGTWVSSTVSRMLRNPLYIGKWEYGKYTTVAKKRLTQSSVSGKKYRPHILKPTPDSERIVVAVPPIVDEGTFQAAQRRLERNLPRNGGAGRPAKYLHILRGMIRCGHCGYAMHGNHDPKGRWKEYRCSGKRHHKDCQLPGFHGYRLEDAVWAWIVGLAKNPQRIDELIAARAQGGDARHRQDADVLKQIEKMIFEKKAERDSIKALHAAGGITTEEAAADLRRNTEEMSNLEQQRNKVLARIEHNSRIGEHVEHVKAAFQALGELDTVELAPEEKRRVLELLEVRVQCTLEGGFKYAYVDCLIDHQRVIVAETGVSATIAEPFPLSTRLEIL